MYRIKLSFFVVALGVFSLVSCKQKEAQPVSNAEAATEIAIPTGKAYYYGDIVPNDLVCMVNNAFMGVEQLEVEYEGKTYYGCCEMCQDRIPTEETARVGVDPYSGNTVDKAEAVIAITGARGEVSYFENKSNYENYMKGLN